MPTNTNPPYPPISPSSVRDTGSIGNNYPLPDWTYTDDCRGLLESSVKFFINGSGIPSTLPRKGSTHPFNSALKCYKVTYTQQDNEIGYYTAEYIGLQNDPTEGEWEISSSTSEQSIILHPDFSIFAVETKGDPSGQTPTKWKKWVKRDKDNEFQNFYAFAPEDLGGVEAYLVPQTTARVTFYTASQSSASTVMGGMGTTRGSPYGCRGIPSSSSGGNWLLVNGSVSQYGTIFRVQTEWMLSSGGKKWNKWLYKQFTA